MAFDPSSRYFDVETATRTVTDADGNDRVLRYKRRRVIPPQDDLPTLAEHRVTEGDRLDTITARYAGDPTLFWRLCDANAVLRPEELETVDRIIRIAMARG
ncbi:LysM domain-containing protein [Geodermatophilus sp. SYSU D01180]